MRIYQRKGVWYIDYRSPSGQRVRKKVGTSRRMAELTLRDIELKIVKAEYLGVTEPKKITFAKLSQEYLQYSKANKTAQSYRRDQVSLKNLLQRFGRKMITSISPYDLERYKNTRKRTVAAATVNRELSCIRHMFTMAVQWGYLRDNKLQIVKKFREPPGRVRYLTDEEISRLLECCADHLRPIVIIALNTGMRKGELLNLRWADVDIRNRVISLPRTKNNERRIIPMNDIVYITLREIGQQLDNQYVFSNGDGQSYGDIKVGFKAALRRAGITDFRFHDLRHTFASRLVMAGVDIRTVQVLMGHKDIRVTMRYSHLSDAHLKEAVRLLEHGTNMAQAPILRVGGLAKR